MPKKVLINGMGTVGSRVGRLLMSMDTQVVGTKVTARKEDIKTQELIQLQNDYKNKLEIYITDGPDYKKREKDFETVGLKTRGPISEIDYEEIGFIIDASPKYTEDENYENIYKELYKEKGINFMIQGGGNEKIIDSLYLSAPNCKGAIEFEELSKNKNLKQVSCNTTFGGTGIGNVLEVVDPKYIHHIDSDFIRREKDPNTKKEKKLEQIYGPEVKTRTHHAHDVEEISQQGIKGKFEDSKALKCPWEHFHLTDININFKNGYKYDFEELKKTFEKYPRCVLLKEDFDVSNIVKRTEDLVPDSDTLIPMYRLIKKEKSNTLEIMGPNPQRSVVGLSETDMVVKKMIKPDAPWEEVFDYVNRNVIWHGKSLGILKDKIKYKTRPES